MVTQVKVTPEEFASRWGSGLRGSIDRIRSGVERVQEAPGKSAAAKADKWHAAISQTSTRDKWARRVAAVSLEEWKQAILTKGVNRIADGVDGAHTKMVLYGEALIAHQNGLLRELDAMNDVTLEDSIARMTHWVRGMAKLQV